MQCVRAWHRQKVTPHAPDDTPLDAPLRLVAAPPVAERKHYDLRVYNFGDDLAFGHDGEREVASLVEALPAHRFPQTAHNTTIEVKRERLGFVTGYFFAEFGSGGRRLSASRYCEQFQRVQHFAPSGIAVSRAEWVVVLFGCAQVWIPRQRLLAKMRAVYAAEREAWRLSGGRYESTRVRWRSGEGGRAHGVLLTPAELLLLADEPDGTAR